MLADQLPGEFSADFESQEQWTGSLIWKRQTARPFTTRTPSVDGSARSGQIVIDLLRRSELFSSPEPFPRPVGLSTGRYNVLGSITCPYLKEAAPFAVYIRSYNYSRLCWSHNDLGSPAGQCNISLWDPRALRDDSRGA